VAHEEAWAAALAEEHTHQRELLATLRGELGAFASECAAALTALDAYGAAVGGAAAAIGTVRTAHANADLVADVYARIAGDEILPVGPAQELLRREPKRSDRELLRAIVDASGVRARVDELLGPAPLAALAALAPLTRWRRDVDTLLESTAKLGSIEPLAPVADAAALVSTLRGAAEHVKSAERAVAEGRLERVLRESREVLKRDLDALTAVLDGAADATTVWRAERRAELAELREEVRVKLDRVERIRRALGLVLPHLQSLVHGLSVAERVDAVQRHRSDLAAALAGVWVAAVPEAVDAGAPRKRRPPRRTLISAAIAIVMLVALAAALATRGGDTARPPEPAGAATPSPAPSAPTQQRAPTPVPSAPKVSPIHSSFVEAQKTTFYTIDVAAKGQGTPKVEWRLATPPGNPTCNDFEVLAPEKAAWHHGGSDCVHNGFQHAGTVTATVTTTAWRCVATFFGTLTKSGPPAQRCTRV
jgi:hypothetical protein